MVRLQRESGRRARVLSRHPHGPVDAVEGDLTTGPGIAKAVSGIDVIAHCASATKSHLVNLPLPFKFAREVAEGALLCPDHEDGVVTFGQYLAENYAR